MLSISQDYLQKEESANFVNKNSIIQFRTSFVSMMLSYAEVIDQKDYLNGDELANSIFHVLLLLFCIQSVNIMNTCISVFSLYVIWIPDREIYKMWIIHSFICIDWDSWWIYILNVTRHTIDFIPQRHLWQTEHLVCCKYSEMLEIQ